MQDSPRYFVIRSRGKWLACLSVGLYLILVIGLLFHTSVHPTILNKYSLPYLAVLLILLILSPSVYFFIRFLLSTQRIQLAEEASYTLTPYRKISVVSIVFLAGYVICEVFLHVKATQDLQERRRYREDFFHPFLQNTRPLNLRSDPEDLSYNIFVFGGSTAESLDFHVVETELREKYPNKNIRIENVATSWFSTLHSIIRLVSLVQDYTPNHIIIYHAINDIYRGFEDKRYSDGQYRDDYGHFYGSLSRVLSQYTNGLDRYSLVIGMIIHALDLRWFSDFRPTKATNSGELVQVSHWRSQNAFKRNLETFIYNAKRVGAKVTLANQPTLLDEVMSKHEINILGMAKWFCNENGRVPDATSLYRAVKLFNSITAEVAKNEGVAFLDIESLVPKDASHFSDDVHYLDPAKKILTSAIKAHIEEEFDNFEEPVPAER